MPGVVTDLLGYRLRELRLPAGIPNLSRGLDSDHDGISNADDNCPLVSNADQAIVPQEICDIQGWVVGVPRDNDDETFGLGLGSGDLDGDGVDEIFAARGATFEVYGLDALGRLERRSVTNTLGQPRNFVVADISGDGNRDVMMVVGEGVLATHLGTGTSSPTAEGVLTSETNLSVNSRYLTDFNGDGRTDIVRTSSGNIDYQVALSVGDGSFNIEYVPVPPGAPYTWLGYADIDLDGIPDSVHLDDYQWFADSSELVFFPITGNGGFGAATVTSLPGTVGLSGTFALVHVNGDAAIDIIGAGSTGGEDWISVSLAQGDGTFAPAVVSSGFSGEFDCVISRVTKFADLNGDGFTDFITTGGQCPVSIGLGTANGQFYPPTLWDTFLPHSTRPPHIGGDFNGDGMPDFVFALGSAAPGRLMVGAIISP